MKKTEFLQKLIELEEKENPNSTITCSYIGYLKTIKKVIEIGDIEL